MFLNNDIINYHALKSGASVVDVDVDKINLLFLIICKRGRKCVH